MRIVESHIEGHSLVVETEWVDTHSGRNVNRDVSVAVLMSRIKVQESDRESLNEGSIHDLTFVILLNMGQSTIILEG